MKVRKHFYFSGWVQGVGFRFKATYLARKYGLTGWVRNLSDGRVEMEAQGDRRVIALLLAKLQQDRYIRIEEIEEREMSLKEGEESFQERW